MRENEGKIDGTFARREFLRAAGITAMAALTPGALALAAPPGEERKKAAWTDEPKGPYAPFRMAIQSYSLRKLTFEKAVEAVFDLKLRFIELYPGHLPHDLPEPQLQEKRKLLRHNMVAQIGYGVVDFTKDHEKNRQFFDYAKKVNLYSISANPAPDSFDSLDKLVEEYKIAVAIHNHGPEDDRHRTPEMIEKAIKDHHKLIGLCVDTGHFMRAGVDPLAVVKHFKDRIYEVHLKDVKSSNKSFTVLGEGDLKTVDLLRELKANGFKGGLALEYEEDEDAPIPPIKKCLAAVEEAVKKL
jgi:inosose dehydratase